MKIFHFSMLLWCSVPLLTLAEVKKGQALFKNPKASWYLQGQVSQKIASSNEGMSVALSADASTLAVGMPVAGGATQIYAKSGGQWHHQARLSQNMAYGNEGFSVSLSADGNTLAAGNPNFNQTNIYTRSGTQWQYQVTLTAEFDGSYEGVSVSLSADGKTLAAGAGSFNGGNGAIFVYINIDGIWNSQATLTQQIKSSLEGVSVFLSADGNTLAAGAPGYGNSSGATQIYKRSGNIWQHISTVSYLIPQAREGSSVSLSANGTILAAGVPQWGHLTGGTQVYSYLGGGLWDYQGTLSQRRAYAWEGSSVSLSADGQTLAVGAPNNTYSVYGAGSTEVYEVTNRAWQHQMTLSEQLPFANEGNSVSFAGSSQLPGDITIAAGAPLYAHSEGLTNIYIN